MKDPLLMNKVVLKNGGQIVREDGTAIVEVNAAGTTTTVTGTETVIASEIALAEGNVLVGNASGVATALNAKTDTRILVGNGTTITSVAVSGDATLANTGAVTLGTAAVTGKVLTGFVSGAGVVAATDTILQGFNKLDGNVAALSAAGVGGALADGNIIVGNAGGVATSVNPSGDVDVSNAGVFSVTALDLETATVTGIADTEIPIGDGVGSVTFAALSGDATMANTGAVTIAAGAVTNEKVADSAGVGALGIRKSATVLYDFSVVGGAQGTIALTGSPTIPDNAVVWVESYDVITTCTSGGADAATIALQLPTDGALTTAIAISDGSNPWDEGVKTGVSGGLATPLPKKTTGARVPSLVVAGGQDLTAGKIVFQLAYWVSQ